MADLINSRKDDAGVDRVGDRLTEPGSAKKESDPRAFSTETSSAETTIPVSVPEKGRTMQISPSPGGRDSSIKTNPKGMHGGRPRRHFSRAHARQLRQQGLSIRAIGARMGVPASTVADALKAISSTKTK
jgi:hypothetical protein